MEDTVEDRERLCVRKRALLTGVGLVVLGLISGLYAYESVKGRDVSMKKGMESAAADADGCSPAHRCLPAGNDRNRDVRDGLILGSRCPVWEHQRRYSHAGRLYGRNETKSYVP